MPTAVATCRPHLHAVPCDRTLLLVAGLPGAGKTTLLRRSANAHGVVALDAEDVAGALRGVPLPYRLLRPVVHAAHVLRVLGACWSAAPRVATTDPLTSRSRHALFAAAARCSGRQLQVVLLHVEPLQARDGQRRRGRHLSERRMRRHERRYARRWGIRPTGEAQQVLTREQADLVRDLGEVLAARERTHAA